MTSTIDDFDENFDDLDDYDDEERGVSGFVVLLIILAMLLAFSFIVWLAYNKGIRQGADSRNIPYVAADPEPVKTPVSGSTVAAGTPQREVYDKIDGRTPARTEVLASAPETPITLDEEDPIAAIAAQAIGGASQTAQEVQSAASNVINDTASSATNAASSVIEGAADRVASTGVRYETADGQNVSSVIDQVADAAPKVTVPPAPSRGVTPVTRAASGAATTSPSAATRAGSTSSGSTQSENSRTNAGIGTHVVQVGAFRSQAEADAFWNRLGQRFGGYLDGKQKDVERADLGSKGIYYRVRIAGFNSRDAASTYCNGLKARNQDCLVKAR